MIRDVGVGLLIESGASTGLPYGAGMKTISATVRVTRFRQPPTNDVAATKLPLFGTASGRSLLRLRMILESHLRSVTEDRGTF